MDRKPYNEREREALESFMDDDKVLGDIGLVIRMVETAFLAGYRASLYELEKDRKAVLMEVMPKVQ